jgi:hypothetical protein
VLFSIIASVILLPFAIAWPLGGLEDADEDLPAKIGSLRARSCR